MAECCAEKTFAATTIADVVGRAGVSRRTFYKNFSSKRDCFEAAIEVFVEQTRVVVEQVKAEGEPWPDTIRRVVIAILESLAANPALTKLALLEAAAVEPALIDSYWTLLIEALRKPRPAGEPVPPVPSARAAIGRSQVLVAEYLIDDRIEQLPDLAPDVVYISLLPFVSQDEVLEQVRKARVPS